MYTWVSEPCYLVLAFGLTQKKDMLLFTDRTIVFVIVCVIVCYGVLTLSDSKSALIYISELHLHHHI